MGKSTTPKFRVEYRDSDRKSAYDGRGVEGRPVKKVAWKDGVKPSDSSLEDWVKKYNSSFKAGGVNFHISKAAGHVVWIHYARIVDQKSNRVVAKYDAPAFSTEDVSPSLHEVAMKAVFESSQKMTTKGAS